LSSEKLQNWGRAIIQAIFVILSLIGYGSRREWLKGFLLGEAYRMGLFEGALIALAVVAFIWMYGQAISEIISGLRALGRQSSTP